MQSQLKKHLLWRIVCPPLLFFTVLVLLAALQCNTTVLLVIGILMIVAWAFAGYQLVASLDRNTDWLIEEINVLPDSPEHANMAQEWFQVLFKTPLERIRNLIRQKEYDLQSEKLHRLRSLVDGQDQERARLSRELHDSVGQSLIAVKLQLEHAGTLSYSQMRAGIDQAKDMTDQTIEEVRRVCNNLMPASLAEFGLETTLRTRCNELGALGGFKVNFATEGSLDRAEKRTQIYLYRIAQEALNNIVKHARATEVHVSLARRDKTVLLQIADNGKGFVYDPSNFAHRNGLSNMRERTQLLAGTFTLESKPGGGTVIKVELPFVTGDGKN